MIENVNLPETKYYDLDLGSQVIKFRKWKNKDRKKFKELIKQDNNNQVLIAKHTLECLVFSCLDKEYALSPDEIQYVLTKIRQASIGQFTEFKYVCDNCGSENVKELNLDSISFNATDVTEIKTDNYIIKLAPVRNIKKYNELIINSGSVLDDLLLRIESINGQTDFSKESLEALFDELETDELDNILDQFKKRFSIKNTVEYTCKNCNYKKTLVFNEIPDFLPESWLSN